MSNLWGGVCRNHSRKYAKPAATIGSVLCVKGHGRTTIGGAYEVEALEAQFEFPSIQREDAPWPATDRCQVRLRPTPGTVVHTIAVCCANPTRGRGPRSDTERLKLRERSGIGGTVRHSAASGLTWCSRKQLLAVYLAAPPSVRSALGAPPAGPYVTCTTTASGQKETSRFDQRQKQGRSPRGRERPRR